MPISIGTNGAALTAQRSLIQTNTTMTTSLRRLSTGQRINGAADDAAGLAIAKRMQAQMGGLKVAQRNANDGISLAQVADGALEEFSNILLRMRDLAVQNGNGALSADDKKMIETEWKELNKELKSIVDNTKFGDKTVFSDLKTGVTTKVGPNGSRSVELKLTKEVKDIGDSVDLTKVDTALKEIGQDRAELGAGINRLQSTVNNLNAIYENTAMANSRIMDADMAFESAQAAKNQATMQAGISAASKANQIPGLVSQLLR